MTVAVDLRSALDPAAFMARAGFAPDPWQAAFLRSNATRSLLLCARQTGKSTTISALASHIGLYRPRSLVLIVAPSQRQSFETFRKVVHFHGAASSREAEKENAHELELANGSRVVSLSGHPENLRGYSAPDLIVMDEARWIPDELYHAATPMLAGGGRVIAMSTPQGRSGWFFDAWHSAGEVWRRTRITADDSPRITADFVTDERAIKPDWRIRQEYFCEFVDDDDQVFPSDAIAAAMTSEAAPLFPIDGAW